MPQGHRPDRIGDQLRMELSEILAREVHDPGIGFVTLTRVEVTPDLQHARVFYTSIGQAAARRQTDRALHRAAPFLRRQIAGRLRLRRVPEIHFTYDEGIEAQDRVEQLLREIHEREAHLAGQDAAAPDTGNPPDDGDNQPE
jgi:ribosome-binding factor A